MAAVAFDLAPGREIAEATCGGGEAEGDMEHQARLPRVLDVGTTGPPPPIGPPPSPAPRTRRVAAWRVKMSRKTRASMMRMLVISLEKKALQLV